MKTARTLLLMRHGKSDWSQYTTDFERPLKKRGHKASRAMGQHLITQGILPDVIISSPARRAIQTARVFCTSARLAAQIIQLNESLYHANLKELLAVLVRYQDQAGTLMLVGHNPGLEDLLVYLVGEDNLPDWEKLMPTTCVAQLELCLNDTNLSPACAELRQLIRPADLNNER